MNYLYTYSMLHVVRVNVPVIAILTVKQAPVGLYHSGAFLGFLSENDVPCSRQVNNLEVKITSSTDVNVN